MSKQIVERLVLAWRILSRRDGPLERHVRQEAAHTGMEDHLLSMARVFSLEGHSGFSAAFARSALTRLLAFEPLRPLTGQKDEWVEVANDLWQNRRCSRVFRNANGDAWDINGVVFREPNGACYTNSNSKTPVVFPYTPHTRFVDVAENSEKPEVTSE